LDKPERLIDLKREEKFIEEYVSLRNRYSELLTTKPVNVAETKEWLKDNQIEVRGLVQDDIFLGAVILYLNRDGEIALFVKDRYQGIGTKLLKIVEQVAEEKKLGSVWAWVLLDNQKAQRAFRKNGYTMEGQSSRFYEGEGKPGIIFRKKIPQRRML
jgi:ribosomal protein S18 acetylase RimI-like enzyme